MNRIFIFILLLALLYALYRYQKSINENQKKKASPQQRNKNERQIIPSNLDNISQISLGSLGDIKSFGNINANQNSCMDSLGSLDNLTYENENEDIIQ